MTYHCCRCSKFHGYNYLSDSYILALKLTLTTHSWQWTRRLKKKKKNLNLRLSVRRSKLKMTEVWLESWDVKFGWCPTPRESFLHLSTNHRKEWDGEIMSFCYWLCVESITKFSPILIFKLNTDRFQAFIWTFTERNVMPHRFNVTEPNICISLKRFSV